MKLSQYIEENGLKPVWLAEKIGVSNVTLWNWIKGNRNPSKAAQKLIAILTNGKVNPEDWKIEKCNELKTEE